MGCGCNLVYLSDGSVESSEFGETDESNESGESDKSNSILSLASLIGLVHIYLCQLNLVTGESDVHNDGFSAT